MWEPCSPFLTPSMPIVTLVPAGDVQSSHKFTINTTPSSTNNSACNSRSSKMTRGRKKDLTIPPTRALVQQRDYRARRAQYVNDLEERCRRMEEENVQLRKELDAARAGQSPAVGYNPQTVQASAELMHNLSLVSASLTRFQHLAFPEPHLLSSKASVSSSSTTDYRLPPLDTVLHGLRPASFPSPAPSPPYAYPQLTSVSPQAYNPPSKKRLHREDSPHSPTINRRESTTDSRRSSPSPSLGSDCCGGFMDCRDLVESESDVPSERSSTTRIARLRSTSAATSPTSYHLHR
ncbi:hypothetical protein BDZ94DRAFT_1318732 [Collybia nuda]|uniref:BZIP domain-containing protein n=1 Tax=Collybia nuda TaxID=64659 RepID=A0A9P6CP44_9AGAR|nr:hypothetical protein BDZ94DRAFT_1318732 [Collybia nuda]